MQTNKKDPPQILGFTGQPCRIDRKSFWLNARLIAVRSDRKQMILLAMEDTA